ncbi:MAG: hypothetical protein H8D34_31620 [Chloroflexi bacterium]|nr:hypothetical protein [Chloroflexota bacterium]
MLTGIMLCWIILGIRSGGILNQGSGYDSVYHWSFFICIAICIPFVFLITKDSYVDRILGELSYPLYLVHGFIIGILLSKGGLTRGSFGSEITIIGCSIGIAGLIYLFIDKPVDHYRRHIETAPLKPMLGYASIIFGCILVVGVISGIRTQFLLPSFPAPELLSVVGEFNIVRFKHLYFAIPHGLGVDWEKDDTSKLPGVLTSTNKDNLLMLLPQS